MPTSIHTPKYKKFRNLLIENRKAANLTQVQLAEKLGRPQSFVSKIESGERRLDVIEFIEWCDAVGCQADKIVKEVL
jgi:transcriptional regulator with XRE-family HTH domain